MADFDPAQFVNRIGQRLVLDFEFAAEAGTPGLIGASRENPARVQLGKLLPAFASIGTGVLIDSYGNRSTQQDVVIFERDFCPVYSINDTPEATYFPIEGVIAAGEVKSSVNKNVLFDALKKVASAKRLQRHSEKTDQGLGLLASYRKFGMGQALAATVKNEYNQAEKFTDRIFTFILCKSFLNSPDSVLQNLVEYADSYGEYLMPNIILSLDDGFIQGMKSDSFELQNCLSVSDSFCYVPAKDRCFSYLVQQLQGHIQAGRSVPLSALHRYMSSVSDGLPKCTARKFR